MNPAQAALSQLVKAALLAALLGVIVRRRYRDAWLFPVYLVLVLVCDTLVSVWPERFYVPSFWILQQTLWDLAKLGVAFEIAVRTLRPFPGALPLGQAALAAVLGGTTLAVISLPTTLSYDGVAFEWQPRVLAGAIWLMTAISLVIAWYRLPVQPFHLAILVGFVPYLLVFVSLSDVLRYHGWKARPWVNLADATAYLAVSVWWGVAAWRRDPQTAVSRETLKRLRFTP